MGNYCTEVSRATIVDEGMTVEVGLGNNNTAESINVTEMVKFAGSQFKEACYNLGSKMKEDFNVTFVSQTKELLVS